MINKEVLLPENLLYIHYIHRVFSQYEFSDKSKGCWLVQSGYFFILDYHLTQMSTEFPRPCQNDFLDSHLGILSTQTVAGKAPLSPGVTVLQNSAALEGIHLVLYLGLQHWKKKRTKQACVCFPFWKRNFYGKHWKVGAQDNICTSSDMIRN